MVVHTLEPSVVVKTMLRLTITDCFQRFAATILLSGVFTTASAAFFVPPSPSNGSQIRLVSEPMTPHNNFHSQPAAKKDPMLPTMIVFDLDDCLWSPEMYTLHAKPSIPEEGDLTPTGRVALPPTTTRSMRGVVGMRVPHGPTVRMFSGARHVLYELATNPKYASIILAAASSSEEPSFSYACLEAIEILPGLTLRKMIQYDQIGRTGQLTSDKRTHFRLLHRDSHVPFEEMLFFDVQP